MIYSICFRPCPWTPAEQRQAQTTHEPPYTAAVACMRRIVCTPQSVIRPSVVAFRDGVFQAAVEERVCDVASRPGGAELDDAI